MLKIPSIVASKHCPVINFLKIFLVVLPISIIFSAFAFSLYAYKIFLACSFNLSLPVKIYAAKTIDIIALKNVPIIFPSYETDLLKNPVTKFFTCSCNCLSLMSIFFIVSFI